MKRIKFTIDSQILTIDYDIEENAIKNINNTNIITDEDLIFDIRYFKNNMSLVAGFLNVMIKNEHVKNALICNSELIEISMVFLNMLPQIENAVIKPDVIIDYKLHLAILKNDTLKTLNCYSIPPYLLERIDTTKTIKIETRNEVFFISNFIRVNNLNNYSEVYYKRKIIICHEFNDADWKDFEQFLIINVHLKIIYFEYVSLDMIKKILEFLSDKNITNILFNIKGDKENLKYFEQIEALVKKSKIVRKNKIKFRIDYTRDYKIDNFIKLLNFTSLKYILIVIIVSSILGFGISEYNVYKSVNEVENIRDEITELLKEFEQYDSVPEPTPTPSVTPGKTTTTTTTTTTKKKVDNSAYYKNYAKVISVLKQSNNDTVGWLTVKGTNVNYPVVQSSNNSYYLNHDFTKKVNSMGWIFMDYRNNKTDLSKNTIIYGHNVSQTSKIMFGSLKNTLEDKWYNNDQNLTIVFNTEKSDMNWKVFSVYKITNTNDYLYTDFDSDDEFLDFVDMIKKRSIYDFKTEVNKDDKILTLSTCQNNGTYRLVVHAVLKKK